MALQKNPATRAPAAHASTLVPPGSAKPAAAKKSGSGASLASTPFWIGLSISIAWVGAVLIIIAKAGPARSFGGVPLVDWALGISAAVSPVAMVWMVTAYLQRAADIQTIADPLRRQLTLITGESGAADARIRRFNQAIREQIELLRNAQSMSQDDLEGILERVREHRTELERFESASTHQVKEVQDVIRRSMLHAEQMMDDKFTMLRVLDGKLQQSGDGVAHQVESMRNQIAQMLEEIEQASAQTAEALANAQRDSQKLADTSRLQESSLTNAAEVAADTLGGLSNKIDLSVTRFLERAASAREEAERLANALDAQTRALDDFTTTLPVRVGEAEAVLRGVADRLYASEQFAREQAVNLSEKLSYQVDGFQSFMDRFTGRMTEIDSGLGRRHGDLNALSERISSTASNFVASWEQSLDTLHDRTGNSLLRFTVVNDEARRNAEAVASHLAETTSKYEDVVIRMRALSTESGVQVQGLTEEITRQLGQFESLSRASAIAGEEVQSRANAALQNLQNMLERVLAAREATQALGEKLVKDISAAVEQNERMIGRLGEAAQLGARTIITATEQLGRQEGELTAKARASESTLTDAVHKLQQQAESASNTLRGQTSNMMNILAEAQGQLSATDQKLQKFATNAIAPVQAAMQQIGASAEQGLHNLSNYGEGLGQQVARLQEFHGRISGMSEDMGRTTAQTAGTFEQLFERFTAARLAQGESVHQTLAQFSDLSERLQHEISGLDGQAARAVETLQEATLKVGEQSYQMLENARASGAQIKDVAAALKAEADQIQIVLRKQSEEVGADLSRAEQNFSTIGEAIRERAEMAYALIDRTTAHYNAVSQSTALELDARAQKIDQTVTYAQSKVEQLQTALAQHAEQIDSGAAKIGAQAAEIAAGSGRAVQNLSSLNDKLAITHESAVAHASQTLSRIDECAGAFERQSRVMAEAAETAASGVYKATAVLGEQTGKLIDGSHQIDTVLRQLTSATSVLADQAAQIRVGMEQQNSRLLAQLADSIAQMDVSGGKLQQIVSVATQGADQASTRFSDMTETASQRITATTKDLQTVAERTETTLAALSINITQQAASLSVVGEQVGEQQRLLASTNESQRTQMIDLFDKLRNAHTQASDVAERSITHLNNALQEVYRQMGMVGDKSQEAIGNVRIASAGFSDQASLLLQNAQAAEQQARAVLTVTSSLQEQAQNLRQSLQTESERAGESLSILLSRLTASGGEVRELGASTNTVFNGLQRALSEQTSELSSSMQLIGDRQRALTAALDVQREAINGLLGRLTLAQDETAAVAERAALRLTDSAQQLSRHAETIDARSQSALNSVQAAASSFANEAQSIETRARQAEQQSHMIVATASGLNEQIGSLLDKVLVGAAEIRDIGGSTEMVLTSLGNSVAQQSASLSSVTQQMNDRQRSLNVTLDAQRDLVNGLLNRLVLAQDETAEIAERTATRLSGSTEQITKQLDTMGATAADALANVETSVGGFVDQADRLHAQAQQTEQQMRGLLSVTSGMQDQAGHLREAMQVESARVIEQLSGVIAQLETVGKALKSEAQTAAQTADSAIQHFATSTQSGAELMRKQSEMLAQAAEQAEALIDSSGDKMRSHLRLVGEVGEQAETQARQLADSAEFATTRVVTLRDTLAATDKGGAEIVNAAHQRIDEIKQLLQAELQRLTEMSRQSVDQMSSVTHDLAAQNVALRANLATSETALAAAAAMVREESAQLPGVLRRNVAEIEAAALAVKEQSVQADEVLIGTADRFISVTSAARNNMIDEMKNVGNVADEAGKILGHFGQLLGEQVASMIQSTALLSGEQKELVERAGNTVGALAEASDRLGKLRGEASDTAERLVREFDTLNQRATASGTRLAQVGEDIAKQAVAITEAAALAESKMSSVTSSFREQMERIRTGLQGQIEDINRGLMQITAQLERTGSSLRSTTVGAVADVERVGQRFEQTSGEATAQIDARTRKMAAATEEVAGMLVAFDKQMEAMLARMAAAGEGIKSREGDALAQLQNVLLHLGAVAEKLESTRQMSGDVSQNAVERLDEVVKNVQTQMNNMAAGAQTAAGIMRGINQIYSDQTQSLSKGVGEAHSQVLTMNKSIDEMQQRADRMRVALKLQGDELMGSLREILSQLEMTGDGFADTVNRRLEQEAEELKKIG